MRNSPARTLKNSTHHIYTINKFQTARVFNCKSSSEGALLTLRRPVVYLLPETLAQSIMVMNCQ